jgi:hypothetical protein
VESSCEFGIEPSGSIKCKLSSGLTTGSLSSNAQLRRDSSWTTVPFTCDIVLQHYYTRHCTHSNNRSSY